MPRHCSATGCKSRDTKEARVAGITFHRLPKKGNPRRDAWILSSCRKGPGGKGLWEPRSDFVYFCSKHFTLDSFELAGVSGYRRLKDDAVPTVVEPRSCQSSKRRGKPRKREAERQTSPVSRAEKETSESRQTPTEECVQSATDGEGTPSTGLTNEDQANEQDPPPSSPKDVTPEPNSACDQPADVVSDPPSPSCYMRRLPPPAGFYVAKEHSYALVYPLVWRRSYEKAVDSLQKALRLLSAARRRENRLRLALMRLRESRFKQTLSQIQHQKRESQGRPGRVSVPESGKAARSDVDESEVEGTTEEMELFQEEEGWRRPGRATKQRTGTEDEEGYCFYCGRGREDEDRTRASDGAKRANFKESQEVCEADAKQSHFYFCDGENQARDASLLPSQPEMLLQTHALSGPTQPTPMPASPLQLQQLHLLHPDVAATQPDATEAEEGGVCGMFLVPVSSETKESTVISVERAIQSMDAQTLLVADNELQHGGDLNVDADLVDLRSYGLRGNRNGLQSTARAAVAGADVKQRLKEHLEGFQLQLSSEFIE